MLKKVYFILFFYATLFGYEQTFDDQNVYYSSEHFRTISGVSYKDDEQIKTLSDKMLDAAEESWQKEVVELGFIQPRNSDEKKIDIYIANKSAYNYEEENYEVIGSQYAGWALSYPSDNTPYFVMNPILNDIQIEVTIAHEFFHTIQFTYFDETKLDDAKWFRNIWWLEATAVLMEDEVYDEVDDYVGFLDPFFETSYKNIELYDNTHEYSMVIFAKYIKENFGMQIIKDTFLRIEDSGEDGYFEILDSLLQKDHNSTIAIELSKFAKWVANPSEYFEEGQLYPALVHFNENDDIAIQKGGIKVVDNINSGWNMVSLPNSKVDELDIKNQISIWGYKDGYWSNNIDNSYSKLIETNSSNGYWVNSDDISYTYFTYFDKTALDTNTLEFGWSLLGTTNSISKDQFATNDFVVWQYKNGVWYAYSNNSNLSQQLNQTGIDELDEISPYSSYWVYKY